MRARPIAACALACGLLAGAVSARAQDWKELKGDHFIVLHRTQDDFAKEVLRRSEEYYRRIADDLGYPRYSNFWQWENRVRIFIHADKDAFRKASGEPEWSEGMADYTRKQILTYAWSQGFTDELLPHEIAHLIFRDFVGFKGEVPLWLDEGVAQCSEPKKRALARHYGRQLVLQQKMFPFHDLTRRDIRQDPDAQSVQFFYMQSLSVVEFMLRRYGSAAFTEFCRQLRDGKTIPQALRSAYGSRLQDLDELQSKWVRDVTEDFE